MNQRDHLLIALIVSNIIIEVLFPKHFLPRSVYESEIKVIGNGLFRACFKILIWVVAFGMVRLAFWWL